MLEGSLARIGVRCGNPKCRCARGQKHTAHSLKRRVQGKTQSLCVPVDLVEEARHWVEEYRRAREVLMSEVSELNRAILQAHVGSKRAKARNRAVAVPAVIPPHLPATRSPSPTARRTPRA